MGPTSVPTTALEFRRRQLWCSPPGEQMSVRAVRTTDTPVGHPATLAFDEPGLGSMLRLRQSTNRG